MRLGLFIGSIGIGIVSAGLPAYASESQTPWECSNYTGEAHTRCVETFAEVQREQIAALQEKVRAQQETVNLLKDQLDRQASANADLQRQLARPPAVVQAVPPFYTYPPVGLGLSLNFGSPGIYGAPFYYSPFAFGPPFYGLRYRSYYGW
ncbi:MAG TPA: hypothetical protein VF205_00845 [Nitrospiraceae bacterium]